MRARPNVALILLLAASLAGCAGNGPKPQADPNATGDPNRLPPGVLNRLEGIVQGPDLSPLSSVRVVVGHLGTNNTTDEAGYYRFDSLPEGEYLITASKDGYRSQNQRARIEDDLILELNFRLDEIPLAQPFNRTTPFTGFISCQAHYQTAPDRQNHPDCGSSLDSNNKQHKDFDVMPGAVRLVVELEWQMQTQAAKVLTMQIESLGDQGILLGSDWGESVHKIIIPPSLVTQAFPNGGKARVRIDSGPSILGEESALDAGLAFQQDFKIHFTVFYIEPGPPTFSAVPKS